MPHGNLDHSVPYARASVSAAPSPIDMPYGNINHPEYVRADVSTAPNLQFQNIDAVNITQHARASVSAAPSLHLQNIHPLRDPDDYGIGINQPLRDPGTYVLGQPLREPRYVPQPFGSQPQPFDQEPPRQARAAQDAPLVAALSALLHAQAKATEAQTAGSQMHDDLVSALTEHARRDGGSIASPSTAC